MAIVHREISKSVVGHALELTDDVKSFDREPRGMIFKSGS